MSPKRLLSSGLPSAATISALSLLMTGRGVRAGAKTPPQLEKS
jgi:hypothetical protein